MAAKNRARKNASTAWKEMGRMVGMDNETTEAEDVCDAVAETPETVEPPVVKTETAVIAAGTVLRGDISTTGDLIVGGTVYGNVQCGGTLQCCGTVKGNIDAGDVLLIAATVYGNLKVARGAQMDAGSTIIGDVEADHIALDGKMRGDLVVAGTTQIDSHAVLLGNISTGVLSIREGSRFCGELKMTGGEDLNRMFGENTGA